MILTISFKVLNEVLIKETWPLNNGDQRFYIKTSNGMIDTIEIIYKGVSSDYAPKFTNIVGKSHAAEITDGPNPLPLNAELTVRSWQTILAPYVAVEIDFDDVQFDYAAEGDEDINIYSFSSHKTPQRNYGASSFEVFAGAYFAKDHAISHIEEISFYRDGIKALTAGRYVDAYNFFYLYIETKFCQGKFKTKEVKAILLSNGYFQNALRVTMEDWTNNNPKNIPYFFADVNFNTTAEKVTNDVILLRGKLRHHSLSNPKRWDPNKQKDFANEAGFLAAICQSSSFQELTSKIWSKEIKETFAKQAEALHMTTMVNTQVTIKLMDHIQNISIDIKVPQKTVDAQLAKFVLGEAIKTLEEKEPAAEIISIRATTGSQKNELFRYDLGPAIRR